MFDATRGLLASAMMALTLLAPGVVHAQDSTVGASIDQFAFTPTPLQISVGTTVTWTNKDTIVHSVTSGVPGADDGQFDSGLFDMIDNGDPAFSYTFTAPGEYPYFCKRHNFMQGTVVVSG